MTQRSPIYVRIGPREHPRNLLTWTNGVQQGLQPTPFIQRQWDWPNPVRAIVNSDLRTWIDGVPQSALSLTIPAGQRQRDWPNPLPYRQNQALLGFAVEPQIAVQVVVSLPFNQTDWPNPQAWRQSSGLRIWVDGIPQTALSLTLPPRQTEWPNPLRVQSTDRTWLYSQQIPAAVVSAMPLNSQDWPNPVARAQNQDLRICIDGIPQTALSLTIPLRQADWPNPILATRSVALALGDVWQNPSLALSLITVPNVVGETQAQAETDLAASGFTASETFAYSDTVAAGLIISQNPVGGSLVPPASIIAIVISLGVQPASGQRPAGRRTKRRKYVIRIEGRVFEAEDESQAIAILEQAQVLAEKAASIRADEIVEKALPKAVSLGAVKPIAIKAPTIQVSDALKAQAQVTQASIDRAYSDASAAAELRLLLALMEAEDDEEEFLLLH